MAFLFCVPWFLLDPSGEHALRQLPSVAAVSVVREGLPKTRIIHLLDWHHVPKDLFILDLEQSRQEKLTSEQAEREYAAFLQDVERIQRDQMAVLRHLARHGLKEVFSEGLSREDHPHYGKLVQSIVELISHCEDRLRTETDRETRALYQVLLLGEREAELNLGAPGRLFMKKEIEVLPLEDKKFWQAARPIKDGKIFFDPVKVEARRDAMVRNCLTRSTAVIVLGASHDLTESLRRIAGGNFEYVRIRVKSFEE